MSILHGVLHLFELELAHGLRLPINCFLRSLAQDQQQLSIGVVLSGMGSDGMLGLRTIKEKAGLALAQEPASAKFDSMPCSVIDAGLVDIVAPADEMPEKIMAFLKHKPLADEWKLLREETLPTLLTGHPEGTLRAWVAGCSTGEEAYSPAIVFKEVMDNLKPKKNFKLQIFASDLGKDAIDKARHGLFLENIAADGSSEQLRRYFTKEDGGYLIKQTASHVLPETIRQVASGKSFFSPLIAKRLADQARKAQADGTPGFPKPAS